MNNEKGKESKDKIKEYEERMKEYLKDSGIDAEYYSMLGIQGKKKMIQGEDYKFIEIEEVV